MKRYDILMIGPLPQPTGGVSVHIRRLADLLSGYFTIGFIDESPVRKPAVFNLRTFNLLQYLYLIWSAHTIHIHSEIRLRIIHMVVCWLLHKDTIVTIHSFANNLNPLLKKLHHFLLRKARRIIIVNASFGHKTGPDLQLIQKEAFIFPDLRTEPPLPGHLINIIEKARKDQRKILINNAWRLDFQQGTDLYGVDLCIDLAIRLKASQVKFLFIFVIPDPRTNADKIDQYKEKIRTSGIGDSFRFIFESISFVRLIEMADIVYRTTLSDGDALSVREALFLDTPVIASDATDRPEGTILFVSRDVDDLYRKTAETLASRPQARTQSAESPVNEAYLKFYRDLYRPSSQP